jgi:hypothetical protein
LEHRHAWNASFHFSFLILTQSVGLVGWGISPSQGRYLHKQNKCRQTSAFCVGFELIIPLFQRAKTIHALDHAATVIGCESDYSSLSNSEVKDAWIYSFTPPMRLPNVLLNFT